VHCSIFAVDYIRALVNPFVAKTTDKVGYFAHVSQVAAAAKLICGLAGLRAGHLGSAINIVVGAIFIHRSFLAISSTKFPLAKRRKRPAKMGSRIAVNGIHFTHIKIKERFSPKSQVM
jgi:hypothetical protein